ncbi:MAG TPA: NrtA/SsuA/CpmA family ABC transporter substrate-binding protein [Syntrophales bacterium]|nr:NrtA/SsuA/CpmA family ABC transporter substrate-binding protein [Syntrophales bacterium]HQI36403.1 NrtA/SsuA/CpmA family ABC transporter substrate-binding protein [Syntrophales bacterium]
MGNTTGRKFPKVVTLGVIVLLAAAVLGGTACRQEPPPAAGPPEKITLAYPTTMLSVLTHIAYRKGYFLAEGLEVTPQLHPFGKPALRAVLDGKADLAVVADTPIMFAVTGGEKIAILAVTGTSRRAVSIVARRDRGIAKAADLKGKRIGVPLGTTGDFFLDSLLTVQGIDRRKIRIVDLKPEEMLNALRQGKVDAVSIWNPTRRKIEAALQENGVRIDDDNIYSDVSCLAARGDYVARHPETVRKALRALLRAETFVRTRPAEAREITAALTGIDPSSVREIWGLYTFQVLLDQALIVSLEDQTRWAVRQGLTPRREVPNYLDFIYTEGLLAVRPEAVRIIR